MSYDQWKTASPFDDIPDPIEDAENYLKATKSWDDPHDLWTREVVKALLQYIEDEI